jgi:hypothetical protein
VNPPLPATPSPARAANDPPRLRASKSVAAGLLQRYARETEPRPGDGEASWQRLRARVADAQGPAAEGWLPAAATGTRSWLLGGLISATLGLCLLLGRGAPLTSPRQDDGAPRGHPGGASGMTEGGNRGTGGMEGASGTHGSGGTA